MLEPEILRKYICTYEGLRKRINHDFSRYLFIFISVESMIQRVIAVCSGLVGYQAHRIVTSSILHQQSEGIYVKFETKKDAQNALEIIKSPMENIYVETVENLLGYWHAFESYLRITQHLPNQLTTAIITLGGTFTESSGALSKNQLFLNFQNFGYPRYVRVDNEHHAVLLFETFAEALSAGIYHGQWQRKDHLDKAFYYIKIEQESKEISFLSRIKEYNSTIYIMAHDILPSSTYQPRQRSLNRNQNSNRLERQINEEQNSWDQDLSQVPLLNSENEIGSFSNQNSNRRSNGNRHLPRKKQRSSYSIKRNSDKSSDSSNSSSNRRSYLPSENNRILSRRQQRSSRRQNFDEINNNSTNRNFNRSNVSSENNRRIHQKEPSFSKRQNSNCQHQEGNDVPSQVESNNENSTINNRNELLDLAHNENSRIVPPKKSGQNVQDNNGNLTQNSIGESDSPDSSSINNHRAEPNFHHEHIYHFHQHHHNIYFISEVCPNLIYFVTVPFQMEGPS